MLEFQPFPKIARLRRDCVITEKLDGTNAQIVIQDGAIVAVGSRSRWITPGKETDNFGFAGWVDQNRDELLKLGEGTHFGEWWGAGIQRTYGLTEKRFSLFNVGRWSDPSLLPACVSTVPKLYEGRFSSELVDTFIGAMRENGSYAVPGFMKPEGIIVWHAAARQLFKVTLEKDDEPKSRAA